MCPALRRLTKKDQLFFTLAVLFIHIAPTIAEPSAVSARGRLEPRDGLFAVAGPSGYAPVVAKLKVQEGDKVERGQIIALLDDIGIKQANVQRAIANRANAENEVKRNEALRIKRMASEAEYEALELMLEIAEAELAQAQAELERAKVKSPINGRVIAVHTRDGERVGSQGIVELGQTGAMYAVAEVYETDIGRLKVGQKARATSSALAKPLTGTIERIGMKVGILETLPTDPVSRIDARVVEVFVRLDRSDLAENLTNLHVEIVFEPH